MAFALNPDQSVGVGGLGLLRPLPTLRRDTAPHPGPFGCYTKKQNKGSFIGKIRVSK